MTRDGVLDVQIDVTRSQKAIRWLSPFAGWSFHIVPETRDGNTVYVERCGFWPAAFWMVILIGPCFVLFAAIDVRFWQLGNKGITAGAIVCAITTLLAYRLLRIATRKKTCTIDVADGKVTIRETWPRRVDQSVNLPDAKLAIRRLQVTGWRFRGWNGYVLIFEIDSAWFVVAAQQDRKTLESFVPKSLAENLEIDEDGAGIHAVIAR